jgi:hypothetical protein
LLGSGDESNSAGDGSGRGKPRICGKGCASRSGRWEVVFVGETRIGWLGKAWSIGWIVSLEIEQRVPLGVDHSSECWRPWTMWANLSSALSLSLRRRPK